MIKIIPKWLFQIIGFGSLLLLGFQLIAWILNNDGLYRIIANLMSFLEDGSLLKTLLTIVLAFFAVFIPWMVVILLLREFTANVKTMKDEIAYLKGESQPEVFDSPTQKARFMGIIAIVVGVVVLGIDIVVWNTTHEGLLSLWLAVPISFALGIYALVTGSFPKR
jgi:predicted tellurium resistance membrane protein TerC